jgi:hypothetical protein
MALKVFISYATHDVQVVNFVRQILAGAPIEVFVADYSVPPGQPLAQSIVAGIVQCDVFVLLWSNNSVSSEWVPQEIGIAKAHNKKVIPIVLNHGLTPPGFIRELKYLDVPRNPEAAFLWLRDNMIANAAQKQQQEQTAWLVLGGALLWILGTKK